MCFLEQAKTQASVALACCNIEPIDFRAIYGSNMRVRRSDLIGEFTFLILANRVRTIA